MAEQEITTLSLARYAPDAKALIVATQALADAAHHAEVTPLHLLSQCLSHDLGIQEVFRRANVNVPDLSSAVESALARQPVARERSCLSRLLLDLMQRAEREAAGAADGLVTLEHLLNALAQEVRGAAGEILGAFQVGPGSLRPHLGGLRSGVEASARAQQGGDPVLGQYTAPLVERARTGRFGPVIGRAVELRRLLTILERREKHHPLLVGDTGVGKATIVRGLAERVARADAPSSVSRLELRELDVGALVAGTRLRGELEARAKTLIDVLSRRERAVLVIFGFEQLYAASSQLGGLADLLRSAVERSALRLCATTTPEGERRIVERDPLLYQRLTRLPVLEPSRDEAIEMVRGAASLYESHHRVRISEAAVSSAVTFAKRYLSDRFLPDSAFDLLDEAAAAKRVEVESVPLDFEQQVRRYEALQAQLGGLSEATDEAGRRTRDGLRREARELEPIVQQAKQTQESRRSARALLETLRGELDAARSARASARARGDLSKAGEAEHMTIPELEARLTRAEASAEKLGVELGEPVLGSEDVARSLALRTGIPMAKMLEAETEKLSQMEARLGERVVGQDPALIKVARAVRRSRVGLRDPRRPIGSFMFLGPTGVGKTELAKALAEFLFDDEHALLRLDMSEYMERHMAQRLLGAPPGYADSEQGGLLTEAVRRRPYSVLLFDEVEKAHQDVFNLLLQVLDDGRLTDGRGRVADFTNCVVIMTSNIGASLGPGARAPSVADAEAGIEELPAELRNALTAFFRPEFLNRIGDIVIFGALDKTHLGRIADIQLRKLEKLLDARGLGLRVSAAAKARLVELGYEPAFGARPLERTIVRQVQDPLAEGVLSGRFLPGQTLHVDVEGDRIVLSAAGAEAPAR